MHIKTIIIVGLLYLAMMLGGAAVGLAGEETSTMACDGGVVNIGDSQDDVQQKCGEPNGQSMDKWVYDFGPSEYFTVIFEEGQVQRILERH